MLKIYYYTMPTRRKRTKRKSRKGGEYGIRRWKTWAENYKNCTNQLIDDPIGTPGGKMAEIKCEETMRTNDYHRNGTANSWDNFNKATVPQMWQNGNIVNENYKKNEFEMGNVKNPEKRYFIQQFEKKSLGKRAMMAASDFGKMVGINNSPSSNWEPVPIANRQEVERDAQSYAPDRYGS